MSSSDFRIERNVELSPETKEIAERELRETPERMREAIERLRELLKENDDLYFSDDDEILTIFLRPCKWYPESALALMRRLAEFRRDNAAFTDDLVPEHEEEAFLRHKMANVMKGRDHKGRRVLIVSVGGKHLIMLISSNKTSIDRFMSCITHSRNLNSRFMKYLNRSFVIALKGIS
ncbi:clavesin-1-like [Galleria mellonella]|uniref:Clavesin-1-like n=1 Tax=Galleria mellonella TaxID=7137 RepID=A0ABM3MTA7_GALME|nr:clavesin-1-like [Galleria mellonella]XP_052754597.1 clavesin-1-like [Galleria mellonella]